MSPLPLAGHADPAEAAQGQVAAETFAGNTSATVAPTTALGPAFEATIVYVSVPF